MYSYIEFYNNCYYLHLLLFPPFSVKAPLSAPRPLRNSSAEGKRFLEEERTRLGIQAPAGEETPVDESNMNVDQKFLAKNAHLRKFVEIIISLNINCVGITL